MVLEGKVALVSGAGGMHGIGRAIALKLAGMGADIALTDVKRAPQELPEEEVKAGWQSIDSVAEEIKQLGRRCEAIYCDITQEDQVIDLISKVASRLGGLNILVNNARAIVGRYIMPLVELEVKEWDHVMAVNLRGMFLCCKHGARLMIKQNAGGRIINMGSEAGKKGAANQSAYCTSKFGVNGLTQSLAIELAPYHITVNAICPGAIDTHRFSYYEQKLAQQEGVPAEVIRNRHLAEVVHAIPLGKVGTPEDVAALTAFLASPEAEYITGQSINVNGGLLFH